MVTPDPRTIVADLRSVYGVVRNSRTSDAADLIDSIVVPLHDQWEADKPPCRNLDCDGGFMSETWMDAHEPFGDGWQGHHPRCPANCDDGVQPFAEWVAGLAAKETP